MASMQGIFLFMFMIFSLAFTAARGGEIRLGVDVSSAAVKSQSEVV